MALIYASAVNRRMHALQKKHSMDLPAVVQAHQPHPQQQHDIVHFKQRSNDDQQIRLLLLDEQQQQQTRESSSADRKRSAPPPATTNRANGIGTSAGGHPQLSANASQHLVHGKSAAAAAEGHAKADRKISVTDQLFRREDGGGGRPQGHRRKISTPVMVQSMVAVLPSQKERGKEKGRLGKTKGRHANSTESPCAAGEEEHGQPKGLLASLGMARRRSLSADETMLFRKRGGTNTSLDSSSDSPAGSPAPRKGSAFQRMRERLNRWKLSG